MRAPRPRLMLTVFASLALGAALALTPAWLALARAGNNVQLVPFGRGTIRTGVSHEGDAQDLGWYWTSTHNWLMTGLSATATSHSDLERDYPRSPATSWSAWKVAAPWWSIAARPPRGLNIIAGHLITQTAAGWPLRCIVIVDASSPSLVPEVADRTAPAWASVPVSIPSGAASTFAHVRVLPAGLLADAALFSTAALLVIAVCSAMNRARLRRRGACPSCAYDRKGLGPSAACPECGATPAKAAPAVAPAP